MTDSLPYDYASWQFLDAIGQASPLQQELQSDEAMSLAFELSAHGRGESDFALLSSDNWLHYGQTSAKAPTAPAGVMHAQPHTPPIEMGMAMAMGMGMGMDMDMEMFAQGMEFISVPPFPDLTLGHGKKTPDELSLLRSTSQDATQRALFMTPSGITSPSSSSSSSSSSSFSNRNSSSPSLDPCTPSTTSSTSKESDEDCEWDCDRDLDPSLGMGLGMHFYNLPDRLDSCPRPPRHIHPPLPHHHHLSHRGVNHRTSAAEDEEDALTPLEMPDGSTRFTANWLPVDPTGGFTIDSPVSASASRMEFGYPYSYGHPQDHYGYAYADADLSMEFSKEAFIQMPAPAPV
ncbi:uncharacterized protein P174DRAFT_464227 [Aspergillus novofumigatus IBT 16806]|uniref:Uncharacterized protein n=1 Tax=Aspergillus novofumigatus (strain IBT 16806) TaxID=1392255 RepID=A0A2I1BWT3_ASPN1|nr:uncharacterized protein P174DRAFT_464227 [Aspergillus novofumigatus IBT 16806]PKX89828.1 hypothetical protein P174DRAFT_464227 [Aspergillus novofumigatus IBT 16806]